MLNEKELTTMGQAVTCPHCGQVSYIYPKGTGYQPYLWEVNCEKCHLFKIGLHAYRPDHRDAVEELQTLMDSFLDQGPIDSTMQRIKELADKIDPILEHTICQCGGRLSVRAKPRCLHCDEVVLDSVFHYVDEPVENN